MHLDGTDGKGAGAGDGEALIFSLDCGKGAISYEGNGVRCEFRIEYEGFIAFEVIQGDGIFSPVYGSGAAGFTINSFALL